MGGVGLQNRWFRVAGVSDRRWPGAATASPGRRSGRAEAEWVQGRGGPRLGAGIGRHPAAVAKRDSAERPAGRERREGCEEPCAQVRPLTLG